MPNVDDVLWESDGRNLAGEPFLSVRQRDGYYYARRGGKDSIAFVVFDSLRGKGGKYALIRSIHGPTPDVALRAFTGSVDSAKPLKEICLQEVMEEAGFGPALWQIHELGSYEVGTQTDEIVHLFAVDVANAFLCGRDPQDKWEEATEVVWFDWWETPRTRDWKVRILLGEIIGKWIGKEAP